MDTESALSSIPNSNSRFWVIESEEGREPRSLFRTCPIIIFFIALRCVATVTHGWRLLLLAVSSATGNGVNTDEHLRDLRAGLPVSHASFELSVSVSLEQQTLSPTPPSQFYGHMSQLVYVNMVYPCYSTWLAGCHPGNSDDRAPSTPRTVQFSPSRNLALCMIIEVTGICRAHSIVRRSSRKYFLEDWEVRGSDVLKVWGTGESPALGRSLSQHRMLAWISVLS